MNAFLPADILLPQVDSMEKWAVIACDQFTSDPAYWARVAETAGDAPSTLRLILPEAELGTPQEAAHTEQINRTMEEYCRKGIFKTYAHSLIYVERVLQNGSVRKGLVGMVDLDAYDYHPNAVSAIRATERTVTERIPPRPACPPERQPGAAPYSAAVRRRPEGADRADHRKAGSADQAV